MLQSNEAFENFEWFSMLRRLRQWYAKRKDQQKSMKVSMSNVKEHSYIHN